MDGCDDRKWSVVMVMQVGVAVVMGGKLKSIICSLVCVCVCVCICVCVCVCICVCVCVSIVSVTCAYCCDGG